jgi:hypothetical protein
MVFQKAAQDKIHYVYTSRQAGNVNINPPKSSPIAEIQKNYFLKI